MTDRAPATGNGSGLRSAQLVGFAAVHLTIMAIGAVAALSASSWLLAPALVLLASAQLFAFVDLAAVGRRPGGPDRASNRAVALARRAPAADVCSFGAAVTSVFGFIGRVPGPLPNTVLAVGLASVAARYAFAGWAPGAIVGLPGPRAAPQPPGAGELFQRDAAGMARAVRDLAIAGGVLVALSSLLYLPGPTGTTTVIALVVVLVAAVAPAAALLPALRATCWSVREDVLDPEAVRRAHERFCAARPTVATACAALAAAAQAPDDIGIVAAGAALPISMQIVTSTGCLWSLVRVVAGDPRPYRLNRAKERSRPARGAG